MRSKPVSEKRYRFHRDPEPIRLPWLFCSRVVTLHVTAPSGYRYQCYVQLPTLTGPCNEQAYLRVHGLSGCMLHGTITMPRPCELVLRETFAEIWDRDRSAKFPDYQPRELIDFFNSDPMFQAEVCAAISTLRS